MSTPTMQVDADSVIDEEWIDLGQEDQLFQDGDCHSVMVGAVRVGLFRIEGKVYAMDDICTHGNARLSEGDVDGFEVECPLHAGAFDVRNGKALCAPLTRDARVHPVCQRGKQIMIKVEQE